MMMSQTFLGFSLVGAEWVLYLLVGISILSVGIMFERFFFIRSLQKGIKEFRKQVRTQAQTASWTEVRKLAETRAYVIDKKVGRSQADADSQIILTLLNDRSAGKNVHSLEQLAADSMLRSKVELEKNLSLLATIGSNAVFVGLFGTVLGIIKAFHDLSQSGSGAQSVMSGISESLVATAVGLLVAIPAVVAFNLFQRKVRQTLTEGEALKSYLIGKLTNNSSSGAV